MNDLSALLNRIEKLSAESLARLTDFVTYLEWQESQQQVQTAQGWSYSFIEAFKGATVRASKDQAGMDVKMGPATVGGESRPALWAHPPLAGQAVIEYYVPVPQQVSQVRLRLAIGIRDGAEIAEDNLVAFSVRVNGSRVWGQQTNAQTWQAADIPLNIMVGDMVRVEFATEALDRHQWTWAVWGAPELSGLLTNP